MHRWVGTLLTTGWVVFALGTLGVGAVGCTASHVGDPCIPESVPADGFKSTEVYAETSSVQCRSRVCLVYHVGGDPSKPAGSVDCPDGGAASGLCPTEAQIDQGVYCTCRCAVPPGVNAPTCGCPGGFHCEELYTVVQAGNGVRGSYCVKDPPTM